MIQLPSRARAVQWSSPKQVKTRSPRRSSRRLTPLTRIAADDYRDAAYGRRAAAADLGLALNGADFIPVTGVGLARYVRRHQRVLRAHATAPLVGAITGGTNASCARLRPAAAQGRSISTRTTPRRSRRLAAAAVVPRDRLVVRFEAVHGPFVELATAICWRSRDAARWCASPPLQAGPLRVRFAINGETFWPPVGGVADIDASNANCSFTPAGLASPLGGYCAAAGCDADSATGGAACGCRGSYHATGFDRALGVSTRACGACCVTESRFYAYDDFEIRYGDGNSLVQTQARLAGVARAPESGLESDGSRVKLAVRPMGAIPTAAYVLDHLVCCFWLAPRETVSNVVTEDVCVVPGCDDPNSAGAPRETFDIFNGLLTNENAVCGGERARVVRPAGEERHRVFAAPSVSTPR